MQVGRGARIAACATREVPGRLEVDHAAPPLDRFAEALTAFRRVLHFDPNHAGALYYDGVLLNEQKRFREAIDRWRRVIDLEPAGEFARRARRDARTAADLHAIFAQVG